MDAMHPSSRFRVSALKCRKENGTELIPAEALNASLVKHSIAIPEQPIATPKADRGYPFVDGQQNPQATESMIFVVLEFRTSLYVSEERTPLRVICPGRHTNRQEEIRHARNTFSGSRSEVGLTVPIYTTCFPMILPFAGADPSPQLEQSVLDRPRRGELHN